MQKITKFAKRRKKMINKSAANEILNKMAESLFENDSDDAVLDQEAIDQAIDHLISAADLLDKENLEKFADNVDNIIHLIATKKQKGAKHRAPKRWFNKMKKIIKKENPDYSEERVNATVGDIWYNELSDKKRVEIYKRYGETKNPNK